MLYEIYHSCKVKGVETTGRLYFTNENPDLTNDKLEKLLGTRNTVISDGKITDFKVIDVKKHEAGSGPEKLKALFMTLHL